MRGKKRKRCGTFLLLVVTVLSLCLSDITVMAAGISPDDVIAGKDGWLFYDTTNALADYRGTDLFADYELANIRISLSKVKNFFDGKGIPLIIFLVPNRERVYSEYMPDEYGPAASYTRIEQLCDYLGDEFNIITPYQDLMRAKLLRPGYNFYYKTDTHWNYLGAYIGAKTLTEAAGRYLPDLSNLFITSKITAGRELAQALNSQDVILDIDYTVEGYGPYKNTYLSVEDEDGNYYHYYTPGAPEQNMVIYGDSFSMGMMPFLGQNYQNIYLHRFAYYKTDVSVEQPSVVVIELLERSLDYIKFYGFSD